MKNIDRISGIFFILTSIVYFNFALFVVNEFLFPTICCFVVGILGFLLAIILLIFKPKI